jgi:Tol biopolymer transport system component
MQDEPAISPDGKQVAYSWDAKEGEHPGIYVKLVGAASPLRLTNEAGAVDHSPAWSPDGGYIAFCRTSGSGSEILRVPALGGPVRRVAQVKECGWGLSWSLDGKFIASPDQTAHGPRSIVLISLESGEAQKLTSPPVEYYYGDISPRFSPDGKSLLFVRARSGGDRNIYVVGLGVDGTAQGEPRKVSGMGEHPEIMGVDWMPDSRRIVYSGPLRGYFGPLFIIPASGGDSIRVAEAGDRVGTALCFAHREQDGLPACLNGREHLENSRSAFSARAQRCGDTVHRVYGMGSAAAIFARRKEDRFRIGPVWDY